MTPQEQERQARLDAYNQQRDDEIRKYIEHNTFNGAAQAYARACNDFGQAILHNLQPWLDACERNFRAVYQAFYPDEAKRLMLREARHRARLSTQRRRVAR